MAFIRCCVITAVLAFCMFITEAQTVFYPVQSSQLLKATAEDAAMLLQKAMPGTHCVSQAYNSTPISGIVFSYDSTITDNQACRVESDGVSFIRFSALQDNGLCYGIYQYLQSLGFRFYQPGSIWEIIPSLGSVYKKTDTTYTSRFKYKSWFISGGHNRWIMDNNTSFGWDTYFGDNGHNWALYQRRNGMTGEYRFNGHRGDIMTSSYLSALQSNPCYVACYDNSRQATSRSVPDVNNEAAMQLWSSSIEQKYTQYKNTIFGNTSLYVNNYRNFNYNYSLVGIEVPDGPQWGNSTDNSSCNTAGYPKESDQNFRLANFTVQKISTAYPDKRFQIYAYSSHADVPSSTVSINDKIDIQVIATAFQSESSSKGLLNRWYSRSSNISEYHYLNIPQWGGETPMFYLQDLEQSLDRIKEKKGQGIILEASPAKFSSLPFLLAANSNLKDNISVDSTLHNFCNDMFAGAANSIYKLLKYWSDDKTVAVGSFMKDNKYRIPLYLQLVNDADLQTQNAEPVVKERIRELKAYLHYMVLYYDWFFDQRSNQAKADKAGMICTYLAKVNRLQIVNSYFLITDMVSKFPVTDNFYIQYNVTNGSAYLNGTLTLITAEEIDNNFRQDYSSYGNIIQQYKFESASAILKQFSLNNLAPLKKINVQVGYTNGFNYPNRSEFFIDAPAPSNFSINYTPQFDMQGKGYINFTVEAIDNALQIIKDFSIDNTSKQGTLNISLPSAGKYKLSVVSKFKSSITLVINTNGNYFYKNGPFLGNKTENYRNDMLSLPGYFYIPAGIRKIYFTVNNSNPGGSGYATAETISKAFVIKDISGSTLLPRLVTPNDSALFYLDVPNSNNGIFWQVTKMEQYNLCFANISNVQWYAQPAMPCSNADFAISVINRNGNCITQLTAASKTAANLKWEITDMGKTYTFSDQPVIELPEYSSPNAVVTLTNEGNCSVTKRISDDAKFLKTKQACGNGAALPAATARPMLYPNPSTGVFNCMQNGVALAASEIIITNAQGLRVANSKDVKQVNISNAPAGLYLYKILVNGEEFTGKLVKL